MVGATASVLDNYLRPRRWAVPSNTAAGKNTNATVWWRIVAHSGGRTSATNATDARPDGVMCAELQGAVRSNVSVGGRVLVCQKKQAKNVELENNSTTEGVEISDEKQLVTKPHAGIRKHEIEKGKEIYWKSGKWKTCERRKMR